MADGERGDGKRVINLALQGGGAHGAFTWGVLDRLLEDERIAIEGISGTSAGAMNAAVLAQGHLKGGAPGARAELDRFWRQISAFALASPVHRGWYERALGTWNIDESPSAVFVDGTAIADKRHPVQALRPDSEIYVMQALSGG